MSTIDRLPDILPDIPVSEGGVPLWRVDESLIAIGDVYKVYMNDLVAFTQFSPYVDRWVEVVHVAPHRGSISLRIVGDEEKLMDSCASWRIYMPPTQMPPGMTKFTVQIAPHRRRKLWL